MFGDGLNLLLALGRIKDIETRLVLGELVISHRPFLAATIRFIHCNLHFKLMENSCIIIIYLHIYELITDPHNNLLPVGLIAQLVGHCTSITEVTVGIPAQV